MRRLVVILLIGLVSAGCGGVALLATGAGVGVGTYAWIQGELKRSYPATYDTVWNAARDALQSLEMPVLSEQRDALKGTIMAKRADGNDVRVNVKYLTDRTTEVAVRVGLFGDRAASTMIHESIQTRL
ncbi:MAG: DUF3568 domain-containing protein [Candidatus Tectimicrobiota bacterium]